MRVAVPLLLCLLLAGCATSLGPASAPEAAPDPPGASGRNLPHLVPLAPVTAARISGGAEPSILTSNDGRLVWIGDTTGVYWSSDNGTSWHAGATYLGDFGLAFGDGVALAQSDTGTLYAAFLHDNRIDVARSTDGKTFGSASLAAGVSGSADRPWLAARGNDVVLFYFDAPAVATGIFEHCARSTDGGLTFADRHPAGGAPQGGKAFYDSQGRFYYSQSGGVLYRYQTCLGGATRFTLIGDEGVNNMIQADVQGTDLYMAAATDSSAKVALSGSHDGGPAKRLVVSPAELKSNTFVTVSAHGDEVAVAWLGSTTAGDPSANGFAGSMDVYLSRVHGFWSDSPQVETQRLTEEPMHQGTICMGGITCTGGRGLLDYFMIDHDKWGGIHVAYTDDRSNPGVRHIHLAPQDGQADPSLVARFSMVVGANDVQVDASSSAAADGSPLTYSWDWGDGSPQGSGVVAGHEYGLGSFDIKLTVATPDGRSAADSRTVAIDGRATAPPVAKFSYSPPSPGAGQQVTFTDRSEAEAGIERITWDFGDGSNATGATAAHAFAAGTYEVLHTVTDVKGASAQSQLHLVVQAASGTGTTTGTTPSATPSKGTPGLGLLAALALVLVAVRRR